MRSIFPYMQSARVILFVLIGVSMSSCSAKAPEGVVVKLRPSEPIKEQDLLTNPDGTPSVQSKEKDDEARLTAPSIGDLASGRVEPPPPEEVKELLKQEGSRWFFGRGIGRTAANIGTAVIFPPYIIYLVGNAGLQLAGLQPLYITNLLPEQSREVVLGVYDGVTSVPGRVNAGLAGHEFDEP